MQNKIQTMENKPEYKSRIIGKASVFFGGKIAVSTGTVEPFGMPAISLSELYENSEPGRTVHKDDERHDTQVWLVFDDIRSIDITCRTTSTTAASC